MGPNGLKGGGSLLKCRGLKQTVRALCGCSRIRALGVGPEGPGTARKTGDKLRLGDEGCHIPF